MKVKVILLVFGALGTRAPLLPETEGYWHWTKNYRTEENCHFYSYSEKCSRFEKSC